MSNDFTTLKAVIRKKLGKNANRQLRKEGYTPAVFYTPNGDSLPIKVKETALLKLFSTHGRTNLFNLEIEGGDAPVNQPCLIWDTEYFPTQKRFQHVDFYGVDLDKELKIRVRLVFKGVSKGVKLGGRLEVYREQIYIFAKPELIPNEIEVDITNLNINQGLRVADLAMPEGVRAYYTDNYPILMVNAPGAKTSYDEEFEEGGEAGEGGEEAAAETAEGEE